ncbi:MAG: hypothetical protein LN415_07845 [Candidatus Thermoplasmatota archaeon]|nr:hypothetical protein [Candidatus Thermoplasmatota archaeon]
MPAKITYEKLMRDDVTQQILNKFFENRKRRQRLRWKDFKGISNQMTRQRRLEGLCEVGVLDKVDKDGKSTKGGKEAPVTYYVLAKKQRNWAIRASDMNSLKDISFDKLTFRQQVSLYGMDESDFEGMEKEKEEFGRILFNMEYLVSSLMKLKMRVLQRRIRQYSESLRDDVKDPLVRWMMECYVWAETLIPPALWGDESGSQFVELEAGRWIKKFRENESLNDDERKRAVRGLEEGLRIASSHDETLQDMRERMMSDSGGLVVGNFGVENATKSQDISKEEGIFETFVESGKEISPYMEKHKLLADYSHADDQYVPGESRLLRAMDRAVKEGGVEFVMEYIEPRNLGIIDYLEMALITGLLEPPSVPSVMELKDYWTTEEE